MDWLFLGIIVGISGLTLFSYSDKANARVADSWYDPHRAEPAYVENKGETDG
jgi:hypothetical protein